MDKLKILQKDLYLELVTNKQYNSIFCIYIVTMNDKIIKEFEKLIKQIKLDIDRKKSNKDIFRLRQISNALDIIIKYNKIIKSGEQLQDIKGIGKGTIRRINEILKKGYLSEISIGIQDTKYMKQVEELEQIYGIGRKTAQKFIQKYNIKSVKQLKKAYMDKKIDLIDDIILGLKYHNVYKQDIPRTETDAINKYFNKIIKKISNNLVYVICGSYRRGKPTSNDIDVLLVHKKIINKKDLEANTNYLKKFVEKLKKDKFIVDDIDKNYNVKYMGFAKYKSNPVRRLDIMYVPYDSYHTSLLHFTGSWEFNRKIRELALDLGYTLNQYGLYKLTKDKKLRIKTKSENDVLHKLGLEYIEPKNR